MVDFGLATGCALIGAVLIAGVVAMTQRSRTAKLVGYLACVILAVAPFTGPYAPIAFGAFVIVLATAALIGHREWSRRT